MNPIRKFLLIAVTLATTDFHLHGQAADLSPVPSSYDLAAMLQAVEQTTPSPAVALPDVGTFYSAQHAPGSPEPWPPMPGNVLGLDAWGLGDGIFVLNDTNLNYDVLAQVAAAMTPAPRPRILMMSGGISPLLSLISNAGSSQVYLTNLVATVANDSVTVTFGIAGGTNGFAYDIYSSTNLPNNPVYSQWTWLGQGYTGNSYVFTNQPIGDAFYILEIPRQTMVVAWGDDSLGQCDVPAGLTNAIDVAGGYNFSLALRADGTVVAWGDNASGETNVPSDLTNVISIAAGGAHALALLQNRTVVAWGGNEAGQTNVPAGLTNVTAVAAGHACSLALLNNGTVVAWGDNYYAQTNIPAIGAALQISAGSVQADALLTNGTVTQWGNFNGGVFGWSSEPADLTNVAGISDGGFHTLALNADGTVVAWGAGTSYPQYQGFGQSIVPAGLSNVAAVSGGNLFSLALQSNGVVAAWGENSSGQSVVPAGLTGVKALSAGGFHGLAVRSGQLTPVILEEPVDEYLVAGGTASFSTKGEGLGGVSYQWDFSGAESSGATNATLQITNAQAAQEGVYHVIVTDNSGLGSITSSNANLYLVAPPIVTSQTLPANQYVYYQSVVTLEAGVSALGQNNGYPVSYQWQFNGANLYGATSSNYTFYATGSGTYSLTVANAAGSVVLSWLVYVIHPGSVVPWGSDAYGQLNADPQITNAISVAAGKAHGVVALDNGSVTNWGSYWTGTTFIAVFPPPPLTNALAVAAGSRHDLVLKKDGTVAAWGMNDAGQANVPANTTNVIAIAAGGQQSLALLQNGMVVQWGATNAPLPIGLTNATAIASGTNFALALLQNSTVTAWGTDNYGQTDVPPGLSNVVAVAAGGAHALALLQNGTIVAWGDSSSGETNVPANLTNVMAVAAGDAHSIALLNTGAVVAWGDNTFGQTNAIAGLGGIKMIAGGGDFSIAVAFSPLTMYAINVSRDLLLIYNSTSAASAEVESYYLKNRPMVGNANVLGINCSNVETVQPTYFTNVIMAQIQSWLATNPTLRPQYVILFYDIPSRMNTNLVEGNPFNPQWPSVQYQLATSCAPGWGPFVTSINFNSTNDCIGYIDKLAFIGSNYSPGQLIIGASAGGYGDTNYVIDDVMNGGPNGYCGSTKASDATNGLASAGVPGSAVLYLDGCVPPAGSLPHLTNSVNLAGYITWGVNGSLSPDYPYNTNVTWSGNSGWWIIETIESFNGQRLAVGQGNFIKWFAPDSFGGTNYSHTPVGGVSHTDEPGLYNVNNSSIYFGLWASGKNLAICAWNSRLTRNFQALGDPFVTR